MKLLMLTVLAGAPLFLSAQTTDNEIKRVAQSRENCVERSLCKVSVYPNPSAGPVHIDAPSGATCQVYSTNGTYVGTWTVGENGLDLIDLTTGTFVAAVQYNGITRTSRVVIL